MNKNILIYFILLILLIPSVSAETYRVFVDKEFGFFGVRASSVNITEYQNKTLFINVGDKVEWQNFVITDERVTIVSDNKLWNESESVLSGNYKMFGYTFNKSGTYRVHIKENTIYQPPENLSEAINNSLPIWFNYQITTSVKYQKIIVGKSISITNKTITQKPKNKIVANNTYSKYEEPEEEYEIETMPQVTAKIEKSTSSYQKYTILELIISIFKRT